MKTPLVKTYTEFVNENINENKYKLGSGYTKNFDYDGMLKFALTVNRKTPADTLNKLYDDMTDVNYHTEAGYLYGKDFKGFHKAVQQTLGESTMSGVYERNVIKVVDEGIDADTITKSVDSGAPYVHNIEKGYYGITDNIGELVEWLEAAASDDSDWKEELKIFKQIEKLVDKSKIGKFL
jgi:hypothetical protein